MTVRLNPDLIPNLLISIEQSKMNEATATQQLASGRNVNQPSDDPAASAALVRNHDQADQDAQFLQNMTSLQAKFQVADSTLSNTYQAMNRALTLAVEGANGTLSASDRQALASEVQGLLNETVSLANATYQGAYLFAGTTVSSPPFTLDPSTNTVTYNGDSQTTTVQLTNGNSITGNVPGDQLFLNGNGSIFGSLQDLYTALNTGNNLSAAVTEVSNAVSKLDSQRVFYGNALNQITLSDSFLNQDKLNLSQQENGLVGADMAEVASNFSQAEVANQATLSATSLILNQKTLLDYMA
ncbi:MAG TPA: flagellar hook-associated protein FlgL [Dongiaceae bacterium]|nr:flagellar hook-associated protein FlgL [Dongiaceae bacterium]